MDATPDPAYEPYGAVLTAHWTEDAEEITPRLPFGFTAESPFAGDELDQIIR